MTHRLPLFSHPSVPISNTTHSVWRPLVERIEDCPLAVCDSRTVSDCDLVECDLVYRDYEGEFYVLHHSSAHSWFYLSGQTREEVTILLNFDSHSDVRKCFFSPIPFSLPR